MQSHPEHVRIHPNVSLRVQNYKNILNCANKIALLSGNTHEGRIFHGKNPPNLADTCPPRSPLRGEEGRSQKLSEIMENYGAIIKDNILGNDY